MEKSNLVKPSRRDFIAKIIPACSFICAGGLGVLAGTLSRGESSIFQEEHMFDREYPRKMTYRQYFQSTNWFFIDFAKTVQKKFGKEETIKLIKKLATEMLLERGQRQAKNAKERSLKSYTRMFTDPKQWEGMLTMKVVEDTETAFELKITECILASIFRKSNAADIGYASICWGDYAWAEGFNTKIKLVRDKTLMQGHEYCNHRYIWTG